MKITFITFYLVNSVIAVSCLSFCTTVLVAQKPTVYTNNFANTVGPEINCTNFTDVGVRFANTEEIRNYDIIQINLYCEFKQRPGKPMHILFKELQPESKEFKVKYGGKPNIELFLAKPEVGSSSYLTDFLKTNTAMSGNAKSQFCCCVESYNKYKVEVKGFLKTGKKFTQYDAYGNPYEVDEFDSGTVLGESEPFDVK